MLAIKWLCSVMIIITMPTAIGREEQERGDINLPKSYVFAHDHHVYTGLKTRTPTKCTSNTACVNICYSAYPYFNVHYHFNKHDWNRILDDQQNLIALRRRVSQMKRQMNDDKKRTDDFMQHQDGLLTDARASLFERALYQTTHPSSAPKFKKQPADVHDRLHALHADFYRPVPSADFIDINQPYYYQMLAEQRS